MDELNAMARVLIIDDEEDLLEACRMVLEEAGHVVETLKEALHAIDVVRIFRPDVVLLDWVMPEQTGGQVLTRIREKIGNVPTVLMSALPAISHESRQLRAAGFLEKPFRAEELVTTIARCAGADEFLAPAPAG